MTALSTPLIALCIPARDAATDLPRLLESVLCQTLPFDEVLLYDDASSDATGRIAQDFGAMVIRSELNTGPSAGKNILASRSRCEWIHFHDADDSLNPQFVERAHPWLTRHDVDVVLFGTEDRDHWTATRMAERRWEDGALREDAVRYCILNTVLNCGVYRRSAFITAGGFDTSEDTKYNEDQAMHLRLALAGLRFRADDYVGNIIYRRGDSMSSGHPIECARAHYHVLEGVAKSTGRRYRCEIGGELWRLAGVAGAYRDWAYVRRCVGLAQSLGYRDPVREDWVFRLLARLHPLTAVAIREQLIRWFKPELRLQVPTA